MDNGNDIPYTHVEIKDEMTSDGKKQQFKVTIKVNKFGVEEMIIQSIEDKMSIVAQNAVIRGQIGEQQGMIHYHDMCLLSCSPRSNGKTPIPKRTSGAHA